MIKRKKIPLILIKCHNLDITLLQLKYQACPSIHTKYARQLLGNIPQVCAQVGGFFLFLLLLLVMNSQDKDKPEYFMTYTENVKSRNGFGRMTDLLMWAFITLYKLKSDKYFQSFLCLETVSKQTVLHSHLVQLRLSRHNR